MKNPFNQIKYVVLAIVVITGAGLFMRLHNINFGLPHSFHADEPEIVEPAIKYTYEFKDIIQNHNWYKMIPVSYVYGTFPTYVLTVLTMTYSKTSNILGLDFSKEQIYVFLRSAVALMSVLIVPLGAWLYFALYKSKTGALITALLLAFNWKLIAHAHYVNTDTILTLLMLGAYVLVFYYLKNGPQRLITLLLGIVLGLCLGTKVTAALTFPLFFLVYFYKKDLYGFAMLVLVILGTFLITNPFSFLFSSDFVFRVYSMSQREAGLVFDSLDYGTLKYFWALVWISTFPVTVLSLLGMVTALKQKDTEKWLRLFHGFLILHVLIYIGFYSLGQRRVDRWLLPILPIVLVYAAVGISKITNFARLLPKFKQRLLIYSLLTAFGMYYLYFTTLLLTQYQRQTPKSAAYLWMQKNLPPTTVKLGITEEGLDPMNKIPFATVIQTNVYESKGAFLEFPPNALYFDYVVLASKPMQNFEKQIVKVTHPHYASRWENFAKTVTDPKQFTLINEFVLPKPNLANLSDVFIYKNNKARIVPPGTILMKAL